MTKQSKAKCRVLQYCTEHSTISTQHSYALYGETPCKSRLYGVYGEFVMYIPLFSRFPLVRKEVYVPYVLIAASLDLFSALSTAASPHYKTAQCKGKG